LLSKRIIPCLDVRDGLLTKGIKFRENLDLGDPVAAARRYYEEGADEIVFYDITASAEGRGIFLDVVERVAEAIFIPFSVGGGLSTVAQMRDVLLAGAEKVSVNSSAVRDPSLISKGAEAFGSQAVVLGLDAKKVPIGDSCPSGYEVVINGGRVPTGLDALAWAIRAEELGAGEICLNSIDADGTKDGYELNLTALIAQNVTIPVIASGGAGHPEHLYQALSQGQASAALVASIVHYNQYSMREIKVFLQAKGLPVRTI
jgi:cyclase